ncbi:MAG: DUF4386 domain-containing protein [Piscinibacter sp.]
MTEAFEQAPQRVLRLAAVLYLAIIVLGLFGEAAVRGTLLVPGDAHATVENLRQSPGLWRLGLAGDLLMHLLDLPVMLVLYALLRPVNRGLALLATLANLVQTAVLATNKLTLVVPLLLIAPDGPGSGLPAAQLDSLVRLSIRAHGHGFAIGLVFFGVACLLRGQLIGDSGFLPKWLGLLLQLAGLAYLVNSFALLLAPSLAEALFPAVLLPAFVGELALCLWLLLRGVDLPRWRQRVQASAQAAASR